MWRRLKRHRSLKLNDRCESADMKIFLQNSRSPNQVLFAFDEVVDASVKTFRWAVAYATRSGCERLISRVSRRMGSARFNASEKHFVISLDFGLTEPRALEFLASLPNSRLRLANVAVLKALRLQPRRAYHPKLYLFDGGRTTAFVIGSANLTNSALIWNTEAVVAGTVVGRKRHWENIWRDCLFDSTEYTASLLREYQRKRGRSRRRPVNPDPVPPPSVMVPGERAVFWDATAAGAVDPTAFDHLWVEAGSMSSGGSHNQLELPRGANRFFGFMHDDYGSAHITIGSPRLTIRGRPFVDRPLTWHGNNMMERINLPTIAQGGFDYRLTAVLFRRHADGFEVNVADWDDDEATAWRSASEALGTVYRVGERGPRICGVF